MANLLTLSRLLLVIVAARLFYASSHIAQLLDFFVIILIFVTDALDGYVARRRNAATLFGALFDIAGDRIVELTLWIVAADNDLVPIWVPLVFVVRGVAVDTIRAGHAGQSGKPPFKIMQTPVGRALVAGKSVRIVYAVVKASAFCGLTLLRPAPVLFPQLWSVLGATLTWLTYACVYLAVALCVIRGLPVVVEFLRTRTDERAVG